jgi:proteasome accessory factor A
VGAETDHGHDADPAFQLSQRAEFFEEVVGLETTLKRPIINTRDEPHSDAERFRRLHVIIGDANLSQTATFVKLGSTALLLAALEDEGPELFPSPPRHPVRAVRSYALDVSLKTVEICEDNKWRSAWDFQDELWQVASDYARRTGASAVATPEEVALILTQWREMLDGVRDDPDSVADRVDWVAKWRIVSGIRDRHDLNDHDARLRAIDLQYHDLRPEKSLAQRVGLRTLLQNDEVREAVHNPPTTTRAYFRGQCVARYPDQIAAANWDSVVFDVGDGPLQRVPMMDPLRGTAALTKDLFELSSTVGELLQALDR